MGKTALRFQEDASLDFKYLRCVVMGILGQLAYFLVSWSSRDWPWKCYCHGSSETLSAVQDTNNGILDSLPEQRHQGRKSLNLLQIHQGLRKLRQGKVGSKLL